DEHGVVALQLIWHDEPPSAAGKQVPPAMVQSVEHGLAASDVTSVPDIESVTPASVEESGSGCVVSALPESIGGSESNAVLSPAAASEAPRPSVARPQAGTRTAVPDAATAASAMESFPT